jgi:hypothetical protein
LAVLRSGSENDAADKVVQLLADGAGPRPIWDGLFLGAVELLVRQPGIVSLHAVTTTNALHYAYAAAQDDATRQFLLLQNAAFLPMFREAMRGRGSVKDFAIDRMAARETTARGDEAVEEIFADVSRRPMDAAEKTLAYAQAGRPLQPWIDRARQLLILKGSDVHDFKFASAVLEDAAHVSADWRGQYLGCAAFALQGSTQRDNPLLQRIRAALEKQKGDGGLF